MKRKEILETLQEGLVEQFDELVRFFEIEGENAELAIARINTANTIMEIQDKLDWTEPKEFESCGCVPPKGNIGNFTTKELVEELSKREGVKRSDLGPDMAEFAMVRTGPAIILEIID